MKDQVTSTEFTVGNYVWVRSITEGEYDIPRACKIVSGRNKQLKVVDDDGQEFWISIGSVIKELHPSSINAVEDMIGLGELEECGILRNLHIRYNNNNIYTYIGMVLIAVNPYQQLHLYTSKKKKKYKENNSFSELPPHLYAIGNECYKKLLLEKRSQCIVVSGETGAGKTESTKLLLEYLAGLSGKQTTIEQQIIEANPILEAFGNARTIHNDNSSRFGKLIELYFNEVGQLESASIRQYLLEKSRVTQLKAGDQNYHIFYSLMKGLSWNEKCELDLKSCYQFDYLNKTEPKVSTELNESTDLLKIKTSMQLLKFSDSEIWNTFVVAATILHLGNISYQSNLTGNIEGTDVKDGVSLNNVSKYLGVEKQSLKETLSKKALFIQGHKTVSEVTKVQAMMSRNGFSKTLYEKLFTYIVEKVNKAISENNHASKYSIRILDIYGFENFEANSFEQLCINYTNEHLQQFFVQHIFKLEQEEYAKDGIKWKHLEFVDNEEILHLIGMRPNSLLMIIDEQSQLITGTDEVIITKSNKAHAKNKHYVKQKSDVSLLFGIAHYAGVVSYSVEGFISKNRNPLSDNWLQIIQSSTNSFIKDIFSKELNEKQGSHQPKVKTVALQYQNSLEALMKIMNASVPYFVRCIKPNKLKKPKIFDHALCCCQLRYSGMMDTARIRRSGYPVRYTYSQFAYKYKIILDLKTKKAKESRKMTEEIMKKVVGNDDYQFGKTKVFLKLIHETTLENARNMILTSKIILIQKNIKAIYARNRFIKMKSAALVIQKVWRGYRVRKDYNIIRQGFLKLQASIRTRTLTYEFTKLRTRITKFQARCRGYLLRKNTIKKFKKKPMLKREDSVGDLDAWITNVFNNALDGIEITSL